MANIMFPTFFNYAQLIRRKREKKISFNYTTIRKKSKRKKNRSETLSKKKKKRFSRYNESLILL